MFPVRTVSLSVVLLALFGGAVETCAQQTQIEAARQFNTAHGTEVSTAARLAVAGEAPSAAADGDSFGVQQLLREAERPQPFRVYADLSSFVTNNVALTHEGRRSDAFLLATFGFEYRRPLGGGFEIEAGSQYAAFRYNKSRELDFASVDAGIGLNYHAAKLAGVDFYLRYDFNELIASAGNDVFFTSHSFILGAQKVIPLGKAHAVFAGVYGELASADPKISARQELGGYAGYRVQATRRLAGEFQYHYGYFDYQEQGRTDHNHALSVSLIYHMTGWSSVSASTYLSWNRSSEEIFTYEAANAGCGITASFHF